MSLQLVIHGIGHSIKERFPEALGFVVSTTGYILGDSVVFVNIMLELFVKLGYIGVSTITIVYIIRKIRTLKK